MCIFTDERKRGNEAKSLKSLKKFILKRPVKCRSGSSDFFSHLPTDLPNYCQLVIDFYRLENLAKLC